MIAAGADADLVIWDPDLTITATQANRHGNVDYTPYEGMTFHGRAGAGLPARGARLRATARCIAEPGSGQFVHRTFAQPAPGPGRPLMADVDAARAVAGLKEIRRLTGDEDGAQRVAWTDTWITARDWLARRARGIDGVTVERDAAGNTWATAPGDSTSAS